MQQTNFYYLQHEFSILYNLATSAEYHLHSDPVISLMKLRQFGEKLVAFVFETHHLNKYVIAIICIATICFDRHDF